ncbi:MAG: hypothetical protein ACKOI1_03470, partial [Bacteroidota bacterium]
MIDLTIHRHFPLLPCLMAVFSLSIPRAGIAQTQKAVTSSPQFSVPAERTLDMAIDEVVGRLSLEQKVGQMTQI